MIAARCPKCGTIGCSGDTIFCDGKTPLKENITESLKLAVLNLNKYRNEWGYIVENENGDYVKLEDILNLF